MSELDEHYLPEFADTVAVATLIAAASRPYGLAPLPYAVEALLFSEWRTFFVDAKTFLAEPSKVASLTQWNSRIPVPAMRDAFIRLERELITKLIKSEYITADYEGAEDTFPNPKKRVPAGFLLAGLSHTRTSTYADKRRARAAGKLLITMLKPQYADDI